MSSRKRALQLSESLVLTAVKAFSLSGCAWTLEDVEKVTNVLFEGTNAHLPALIDNTAHMLGNVSEDTPSKGRVYLPSRRLRLSREELRRLALRKRWANNNARKREQFKAEGRCVKCGGDRDREGLLTCSKCLARASRYNRRHREGKVSGCRMQQSRPHALR